MQTLYLILVISVVTLMGAALAAYIRVRRHMKSSDARLKAMLQEIEQENILDQISRRR